MSTSPRKALEQIGANLQKQYERWQPRARYKPLLDPTVEDVKKLCTSLRRNAKVNMSMCYGKSCSCSLLFYCSLSVCCFITMVMAFPSQPLMERSGFLIRYCLYWYSYSDNHGDILHKTKCWKFHNLQEGNSFFHFHNLNSQKGNSFVLSSHLLLRILLEDVV